MSKAKCSAPCCTKECNSYVFILKDGESSMDMVRLKHPQSGSGAMFLLSSEDKEVYEVLTFDDTYRSYFVDNCVQSDGKLYMTTRMDPLFLVLPYLVSNGRCSPIDQVLTDKDYPHVSRLIAMSLDRLNLVADRKGDESLNAFKYNEEKTLNWLERKVKRTAHVLKERKNHVGSATSVSANFIKGEHEKDSDENYLLYSFGIVSDYITEELKEKLSKHLSLPSEIDVKRKLQTIKSDDMNEAKKRKTDENSSLPVNMTPKVKTPAPKAKEKARAKAAVGTKSISSFFAKK